jgi:hypothetical protein
MVSCQAGQELRLTSKPEVHTTASIMLPKSSDSMWAFVSVEVVLGEKKKNAKVRFLSLNTLTTDLFIYFSLLVTCP